MLRTYGANGSVSEKTVNWIKKVEQTTDNLSKEPVPIRSVADYKVPNINSEVQLPRTYGFTHGAMLPLLGAAGDSISTHMALKQAHTVEVNSLINTSPAGLLGLFAIKAGAIYVLDQQKPEIRKPGLKMTAGLWNGVIANNFLVAVGAANPVGIIAGIAYGVYMYKKESDILEKEETLAKQAYNPMR